MTEITAIRAGRGRQRVNVFLDGTFTFSLEAEVAVKEGLQVGQELSASQIEALARSDHFHRCLKAAVHYLSSDMAAYCFSALLDCFSTP